MTGTRPFLAAIPSQAVKTLMSEKSVPRINTKLIRILGDGEWIR